jgi:hypothetical protein
MKQGTGSDVHVVVEELALLSKKRKHDKVSESTVVRPSVKTNPYRGTFWLRIEWEVVVSS